MLFICHNQRVVYAASGLSPEKEYAMEVLAAAGITADQYFLNVSRRSKEGAMKLVVIWHGNHTCSFFKEIQEVLCCSGDKSGRFEIPVNVSVF